MADAYTDNIGLTKVEVGASSGTWGGKLNTVMDILDRAAGGVGTITLSGTTHTLTTTDGTATDGQYRVLILAGSPSGTNTVTISPNDQAKFYIASNTSGQSVILTQGSGGNVTIANGAAKVVYADGAGAGAEVVDVTGLLALNTAVLRTDTTNTLTAGYDSDLHALGTITSGTVTPEVDGSGTENFKTLTNNGAFTLAPPSTSSATSIRIRVINAASAGTITTSGFDAVFGTYATTNAKEYWFYIDWDGTRATLTIREIV